MRSLVSHPWSYRGRLTLHAQGQEEKRPKSGRLDLFTSFGECCLYDRAEVLRAPAKVDLIGLVMGRRWDSDRGSKKALFWMALTQLQLLYGVLD